MLDSSEYVILTSEANSPSDKLACHDKVERVYAQEPVVNETSRPPAYQYPASPRWPNLSANDETKLTAKTDGELLARDLKRLSREARG